ncbi:phage minor tail protein G [Atlantibacter hermannii]|uniref:phage tail assembly chaperone G n=1 Tax=Atlantibacter subterraneus TaxID=255519 RepID=UPI00289AD809|nr:phage minor tail protein G [Atlantibacter subterranea]MDZ5666807.1 phage minor tail protein G [Atlantibacter hermannii]
MSKFLKSGQLEHGEQTITLYELSALQRIEHLQFIASAAKALPADTDEETLYPLLVEQDIRQGARLVAMSLWHADPANSDIEQLYQDVLSGWPITLIGAAVRIVKSLSDMLPEDEEQPDNPDETVALTPEKSLPAS